MEKASAVALKTASELLYRRTFLRSHVTGIVQPPLDGEKTARQIDVAKDLLAMQSLRARVDQEWKRAQTPPGPYDPPLRVPFALQQRLRALTSPRHFFGLSSEGDPSAANSESSALASRGPSLRLYQPVKVRVSNPPGDMACRFDDLSSLLVMLECDWMKRAGRRGYGVLLQSRSGAGKTVACWKAWYDCLQSDQGDEPSALPRLANCVPCWISPISAAEFSVAKRISSDPGDLVLYLLGRAGGLISDESSLSGAVAHELLKQSCDEVAAYCLHGPRLLLFCDLNHFEPGLRKELATGLVSFQDRFAERHCCVVTYRSASRGDDTSIILGESRQFLDIDLEPMLPLVAVSYLRNFRQFEQELFRVLRVEFPDLPDAVRDVEAECDQLERLVERTQMRGEPLISTPLLMHWVSELSPEDLRKTQNITHLYRHVVEKQVDRHANDLARLMPDGRNSLIAAMTRIALVIQAGDNQVRVPIERAFAALSNPHADRDTKASWWPQADFWWRTNDGPENGSDGLFPYYHLKFSTLPDQRFQVAGVGPSQLKRILELGLFRLDDDSLGFVHDSLIAYFAGSVALREYLGPRCPDWHQSVERNNQFVWLNCVYNRIMAAPERWTQAVEFLAGALEPLSQGVSVPDPVWTESIDDMLHKAVFLSQAFALSDPSEAVVRLTYHVSRGASRIVVLDQMARAIEERRTLLHRKPQLLPQVIQHWFKHLATQQVEDESTDKPSAEKTSDRHGELSDVRLTLSCQIFVRHLIDLQRKIFAGGTPWLRLLDGTRSPYLLENFDFDATVTALLVVHWPQSAATHEECVLAGLSNGELQLWNPLAGEVHLLGRHAPVDDEDFSDECEIILLRQSLDGLIHSADSRGGLRVGTPLAGNKPQLRMKTVKETAGIPASISGEFSQFRDHAVTPSGEIACLDDDGRLHLFEAEDHSQIPLGGEHSSINQHQKGLCVWGRDTIVTSREGCLKIIEPNAGVLESLFNVGFDIDRITAAHGRVAVWEEDGRRIIVWDSRTQSTQEYQVEIYANLRGIGLQADGSLIAVTGEQVLRMHPYSEPTVLYPPSEHELADDEAPWTCITSCWCSQDLVVVCDNKRLVVIPLTEQADCGLASIPGVSRRGRGYMLFSPPDNFFADDAKVTWLSDVGIVSVWDDGNIRATSRRGRTTTHKFEVGVLSNAAAIVPGPAGSVLISDRDQLWQFHLKSTQLVPIMKDLWSPPSGGYDLRNRIHASNGYALWCLTNDGVEATILCDFETLAGTSIKGMHVSARGHVLIAAGNQSVYRWRRNESRSATGSGPDEDTPTSNRPISCPRIRFRSVDGRRGVISEYGFFSGEAKITCLTPDANGREILIGCDNGAVFRFTSHERSSTLVGRLPIKWLEKTRHNQTSERREDSSPSWQIERVISSAFSDVFIVGRSRSNHGTGGFRWEKDIYALWAVVSGVLLSEPLWTGSDPIASLACSEDGSLIATTGDFGSPSVFLRWNRLRRDHGENSSVSFQQVTLMDGNRAETSAGVKCTHEGGMVSFGCRMLAFVEKDNECRMSILDPMRPVPHLRKDVRRLVQVVSGATVADLTCVSADRLERIVESGRELLHEIPPVLFNVSYQHEPEELTSDIRHAYRDCHGNIAFSTRTGHVYYHNATSGKLSVLIEPDLRENGLPDYPSEESLMIDVRGRVLRWYRDSVNPAVWHLQVCGCCDTLLKSVFSLASDSLPDGARMTSSSITRDGEILIAATFNRGKRGTYGQSKIDFSHGRMAVFIVRPDQWKSVEQLCDIEWSGPDAKLSVTTIAKWSSERLLLGFNNGQIAILNPQEAVQALKEARLVWLSRSHAPRPVVKIDAINHQCFVSASGREFQIGTADEVLLDYHSDSNINDLVYMPGKPPWVYVNDDDTGTLLEVMGDCRAFQ